MNNYDLLGRLDAMRKVRLSFGRIDDFIRDFAQGPHQKDALYPHKASQWWRSTSVSLDCLCY